MGKFIDSAKKCDPETFFLGTGRYWRVEDVAEQI